MTPLTFFARYVLCFFPQKQSFRPPCLLAYGKLGGQELMSRHGLLKGKTQSGEQS